MRTLTMPTIPLLLLLAPLSGAFRLPVSTRATRSRGPVCCASAPTPTGQQNVLILDHLNINHERGRHDLLKAFYFELLGLSVDPRKEQNLEAGSKTLWANAGINQFHLPEGSTAQVLDGSVTLVYASLDAVRKRLETPPSVLAESSFRWSEDGSSGEIAVTDPWGTQFVLRADPSAIDARGVQPGPASECGGIADICLHVPPTPGSLAAIGRFYEGVLGCAVASSDESELVLRCGPTQTLTFRHRADGAPVQHEELEELEGGLRANHGAHVSMYVADLPGAYRRAEALGATFVNERFSRRAYTLEQAAEQCMFRVLDVVDPLDAAAGPVLRLEHEIRSCVKTDGSKYKSCPFEEIPPEVSGASATATTAATAATTATRKPTPTMSATAEAAEASTTSGARIEFGGIPHVGVLVADAAMALEYYTQVLGMVAQPDEPMAVAGACVRVGAQTIHLMEVAENPDPAAVDPTYSMSAPPPGYVARGRPVHAGRDRHVAITLHDLAPLKASLEANGVNYTMSYSGRQALFCRDPDGNGWEFGPPKTYEGATRLFPPYLAPAAPDDGDDGAIGWGGMPHVGLLGSDTERARAFYCGVLGMVDENDLRPLKLPFPGLFLRCGEQQVHYLELPNPDPLDARPAHGRDRRTAYSVQSLAPVQAALKEAGVACTTGVWTGKQVLWCRDPDMNELMFVEEPDIQPIAEARDGPMVPWTRLW